jgi:5-methylthioadenosine/S-adenosylhomocysteine deaminase
MTIVPAALDTMNNDEPQAIDTLIEAEWIAPVDPPNSVLTGHALAVHDGAIVELLPVRQARCRYNPKNDIRLPGHLLIPGFVNAHTHAAMTLLRGFADDLPLMAWLQQRIWPSEQALVSEEFVHDGTLLACTEMLRGGITCFSDMYFFPGAAAQAARRVGMRAVLGLVVLDVPTRYAQSADDYIAQGLAVRDVLCDESLLYFCMAPHAPYTVSDPTLEHIATLAAQLNLPVHMHLAETSSEIEQSLSTYGIRPLERLHRCGLLDPRLIAVHAIHLVSEEINALARNGAHVVHCPTSNMKLASGAAPLAAMRTAGLNIALGTDGAASNNRLDMFQEMRHAALLGKLSSQDAAFLPAHEILRMATLGGAQALGLDDHMGSLRPGKRADLCAVDLSDSLLQPCYDPLTHLVYTAGRDQVSHVWVDGQLRITNRYPLENREEQLRSLASLWHDRVCSLFQMC